MNLDSIIDHLVEIVDICYGDNNNDNSTIETGNLKF